MADPVQRRVPAAPSTPDLNLKVEKRGRSLGQAVVTAVVLIALMGLSYVIGATAFFVLAVTVVSIAVFELLDALLHTGHRPNRLFGVACAFSMMLVAFLERPVLIPVVLAGTLLGAFLLALRPARGDTAISDVAWTLLAVAWVGGGGTGAVAILTLPGNRVLLLVVVVLTTAINDIGAYFAGTSFGRRKLAPSISPGKSWEGAVAGGAAALGFGAVMGYAIGNLSVLDGLALGAISALLAPIGDLMESLAKREIGIKDSGRLLPGHGGFLDRLDAIVFCAPAAFLYLRFVTF